MIMAVPHYLQSMNDVYWVFHGGTCHISQVYSVQIFAVRCFLHEKIPGWTLVLHTFKI